MKTRNAEGGTVLPCHVIGLGARPLVDASADTFDPSILRRSVWQRGLEIVYPYLAWILTFGISIHLRQLLIRGFRRNVVRAPGRRQSLLLPARSKWADANYFEVEFGPEPRSDGNLV